jgi:hypothetical protein
MTCLRRQVVTVDPLCVPGNAVVAEGKREGFVVPLAADPSAPATQQLSPDERVRALAQLQRIVSAVAAEHPALGAVKEPLEAPLQMASAASQMEAPLQMHGEDVGPVTKKRPRDRSYDEDPLEEERVAVWNQVTGKKLTGQAAPKRKNLDKYLRQHPDFTLLYEDGAPSAAAAAANAAANAAPASSVPASSETMAWPTRRPRTAEGLRARPKQPEALAGEVAVTPPMVPTVFEPLPLGGNYERLSPLIGKGTPDFGMFDVFRL